MMWEMNKLSNTVEKPELAIKTLPGRLRNA